MLVPVTKPFYESVGARRELAVWVVGAVEEGRRVRTMVSCQADPALAALSCVCCLHVSDVWIFGSDVKQREVKKG